MLGKLFCGSDYRAFLASAGIFLVLGELACLHGVLYGPGYVDPLVLTGLFCMAIALGIYATIKASNGVPTFVGFMAGMAIASRLYEPLLSLFQ